MSRYPHRFVILVPMDRLTPANSAAAAWDPAEGGSTFGTVRLSPDGEEPATHTGCNTALTETMRQHVLSALGNAPFYAIHQRQAGESAAQLWWRALAAEGLQPIEEDDPSKE